MSAYRPAVATPMSCDPRSPSPWPCLPPSESVWRAAGTIILGAKSGTQTMHALALTALLCEGLLIFRPLGGVKAGFPFYFFILLQYKEKLCINLGT